MTFKEWVISRGSSRLDEQRIGQWYFNSAPMHIADAVHGVNHLDPFYVETIERMYILNNFLSFAELVWDVSDPEEIELAKQLVLSEPNAVRN